MSAIERIESIILIFVGLIGMTLWYNHWVEPHDEMRYAVMECMGDRTSEAAYHECHQYLADERNRQAGNR